jgi:hypothetical protein
MAEVEILKGNATGMRKTVSDYKAKQLEKVGFLRIIKDRPVITKRKADAEQADGSKPADEVKPAVTTNRGYNRKDIVAEGE